MRRIVAPLLATALAATATPAAAGREDGTLRVATWNTYLLSNVFKCLPAPYDVPAMVDCLAKSTSLSGMFSPDEPIEDADRIAASILKLGDAVDVIALNEVWDESAKQELIKKLSPTFPHYVSRVDAGGVGTVTDALTALGIPDIAARYVTSFEDSGLMIFARAPVEFLPMGAATPVAAGGIQGTVPAARVRARTYKQASGIDRLAAKGMAAVHIQMKTGQALARAYIVFTHMQADADQATARDGQFAEMKDFIEVNVLDPQRNKAQELARVLVVGDLNVLGQDAVLPLAAGSTPDAEWIKRFTKATAFPGLRLGDSWARENSDRYRGATYRRSKLEEGDRLDYLLSAPATAALGFCVQHSQVRLYNGGSDHAALVSDLNERFFFCNPRDAAKPAPDGVFQPQIGAEKDPIRIATPGAMQWFRFTGTSASTIDIVVDNPAVALKMYEPDNLAVDIPAVKGAPGQRSISWSAPADYFIRAAGVARGFVGNYSVAFSRRACSSPEQPCILRPTVPQSAQFKADTLLGLQDAAWFRADVTEQADTGKAQAVTVTVAAPKSYAVTLHDAATLAPIKTATTFEAATGWTLKLSMPGIRNMIVRVARGKEPADKKTPATVTARWTNDLTVTQVTQLMCFDETNGFLGSEAGEDEISLTLKHDGIVTETPSSSYISTDCDNTKDFVDGFDRTMRGKGPVEGRLTEWDPPLPANKSDTQSVPPLAPDQLMEAQNAMPFEFAGGEYRLYYQRRRGSSGLNPVTD